MSSVYISSCTYCHNASKFKCCQKILIDFCFKNGLGLGCSELFFFPLESRNCRICERFYMLCSNQFFGLPNCMKSKQWWVSEVFPARQKHTSLLTILSCIKWYKCKRHWGNFCELFHFDIASVLTSNKSEEHSTFQTAEITVWIRNGFRKGSLLESSWNHQKPSKVVVALLKSCGMWNGYLSLWIKLLMLVRLECSSDENMFS